MVTFEASNIMKDQRGYLDRDQIPKIIQALETDRDRLLIALLVTTGRRVTEIVGRKAYIHRNRTLGIEKEYPEIPPFKAKDIIWKRSEGIFNIIKKKSLIRKIKPINHEVMQELWEYVVKNKIEPDQPLFNITRFRVHQIFRKACENVGIYYIGDKKPHIHHLRHTYAVLHLRASNRSDAIIMIKNALEHSNLNVTSGYLQFDNRELRKLQEKTFGGSSP